MFIPTENIDALAPQLEALLRTPPDFQFDLVLCYTAKVAVAPSGEKPSVSVSEGKTGLRLSALCAQSTESTRITILNRRPDLTAILVDVVERTMPLTGGGNGGVGVGACGPAVMVDDLEKLVYHFPKAEAKRVGGVEMHAERFSL